MTPVCIYIPEKLVWAPFWAGQELFYRMWDWGHQRASTILKVRGVTVFSARPLSEDFCMWHSSGSLLLELFNYIQLLTGQLGTLEFFNVTLWCHCHGNRRSYIPDVCDLSLDPFVLFFVVFNCNLIRFINISFEMLRFCCPWVKMLLCIFLKIFRPLQSRAEAGLLLGIDLF